MLYGHSNEPFPFDEALNERWHSHQFFTAFGQVSLFLFVLCQFTPGSIEAQQSAVACLTAFSSTMTDSSSCVPGGCSLFVFVLIQTAGARAGGRGSAESGRTPEPKEEAALRTIPGSRLGSLRGRAHRRRRSSDRVQVGHLSMSTT